MQFGGGIPSHVFWGKDSITINQAPAVTNVRRRHGGSARRVATAFTDVFLRASDGLRRGCRKRITSGGLHLNRQDVAGEHLAPDRKTIALQQRVGGESQELLHGRSDARELGRWR